jgi:heavy metal sensor kinase
MRPSFRLRLALMLAALTGLALGGFGLAAWLLIRDAKLQRVDAELRSFAERVAAPGGAEGRWQALETELVGRVSAGDARTVAILVLGGQGEPLFASTSWPVALDARRLPWPPTPRPALRRMSYEPPSPVSPKLPLATLAQADADGWRPPPDRPRPPPPPHRSEDGRFRPPPPERPRYDEPPPIDGRAYDRPGDLPSRYSTVPSPGPPPRLPGEAREAPPPASPDVGETAPSASSAAPLGQPKSSPALQIPAPVPMDPMPQIGRIGNGLPPPPAVTLARLPADGSNWRLALATTDPGRVAVAFSERAIDIEMADTRNALLMAIAPALLLIAFGAWFAATRALRPVQQLTAAIRRVTAEGLDQRVAAHEADREFAQLIGVFNAMLERLERGFRQASRFSADAAHELKTPLAILQGEIERRINQSEAGSEMQVALTGILDEVRRLSMITRKLLMLAQADAGRLPLERRSLDLTAMLAQLVEDARMLAPDLNVTSVIPERLRVHADQSLIEQVLHNLIGNAIKYNAEPGWIHIAASRSVQQVLVSVSNASQGIVPGDEQRVFERFYRGDHAHGRTIDGVGLGLSLAREIARAHGGELTLQVGRDHRVFVQLALPREGSISDRRQPEPRRTAAAPARAQAQALAAPARAGSA